MIILIKLLLAHFISDFLLQPDSWVTEKENKKMKSPRLYLHFLMYGALTLLLLWDIKYWFLVLILMVVHAGIDILKLYRHNQKNKQYWFFIDQALHISSIFIVWYAFTKPEINFTNLLTHSSLWIYTLAVLFITVVSSVIVRELMYTWAQNISDNKDDSLKKAGKYIGMIERIFVFTFVIAGRWEAIGFLLAAKSIFRFGDLKDSKDRKLTEYILIGTLTSFGIAMATGIIVLNIITIVR